MESITPGQVIITGSDNATRDLLAFLLADEGYAACAPPPLHHEAVRTGDPAALIAIVDRARDDAAALVSLWRTAPPSPLVVLARGADRALRQHAFALGAVDVIALPAIPRELQARLRVALRCAGPAPGLTECAEEARAGRVVLRLARREVGRRRVLARP